MERKNIPPSRRRTDGSRKTKPRVRSVPSLRKFVSGGIFPLALGMMLLCGPWPAAARPVGSVRFSDTTVQRHSNGTSDVLYIEGIPFFMDRTPLERFDGYAELFAGLDTSSDIEVLGDIKNPVPVSGHRDKNYEAIWKITGDTLFLSDIRFSAWERHTEPFLKFPHDEQYRALERLTGLAFRFDEGPMKAPPVSPAGVLEARWFSGTLLVRPARKTQAQPPETDTPQPLYRLTFENGRRVKTEKIGRETKTDEPAPRPSTHPA